jgi:DNA-binding LacI/PurR family transcriptional regulator
MAVTIYQIAERVGLSPKTVSRILSGKAALHKPETRERVLQVATELGYRANSSARAMRRQRFGCVTLLLSNVRQRSVLPSAREDGIQAALGEHDLHLMVAPLPDAKLTDQGFVPRILREYGSDGLLVNYNTRIPPRMETLLDAHNLPSVWINVRRDSDCVYPDDLQAGRQAAERLLALGHRRIAFVDYTEQNHYSNGTARRAAGRRWRRSSRNSRCCARRRAGTPSSRSRRPRVAAAPGKAYRLRRLQHDVALPLLYAARGWAWTCPGTCR